MIVLVPLLHIVALVGTPRFNVRVSVSSGNVSSVRVRVIFAVVLPAGITICHPLVSVASLQILALELGFTVYGTVISNPLAWERFTVRV